MTLTRASRQGKPPGMEGRLAFKSIDSGEQLVVKERSQLIAEPQIHIAVGECGVRHPRGFLRHWLQSISWQTHGQFSFASRYLSFPFWYSGAFSSSPTVSNSRYVNATINKRRLAKSR
jgi:hypothetical protein